MATPAGVEYDPTLQQYVTAPPPDTADAASFDFDAEGRAARKKAYHASQESGTAGPVAAPPPPVVDAGAFDFGAAERLANKTAYYAEQGGLLGAAGQQLFEPYVREDQELPAAPISPIAEEEAGGLFRQAQGQLLTDGTFDTTADTDTPEGWSNVYTNNYNKMVYGPGGVMETAGTNAGTVLQGVSEYVLEQIANAANDPMLKQQLDQFAIAAEAARSEIQAAASRTGDPAAQAAMIAQGEVNILDRLGNLMSQQSKEHRDYVLNLIQTATGTAGVELGETQVNEQSRQFYAGLSQNDQQYWNTLSQDNQQFISKLNQDQQQYLMTHGLDTQNAKDAMTRWSAELQWDKEKTATINALDWRKFEATLGLSQQEMNLKLAEFAQDQANWSSTFEFDQEKFAKTFGFTVEQFNKELGLKVEELALNRLQVNAQIDSMDWDEIHSSIELLMEQENVDGAALMTAQMIGARLYGPNTPEYSEFVKNATQGYVVGLSGGTWAYLASKVKPGQAPPAQISLMGNDYEILSVGKPADGAYDLYADGQKIGTWDTAAGVFVMDKDNPLVKSIDALDGELVEDVEPATNTPQPLKYGEKAYIAGKIYTFGGQPAKYITGGGAGDGLIFQTTRDNQYHYMNPDGSVEKMTLPPGFLASAPAPGTTVMYNT